jgi:hypothetical protein
MISYLDFTTAYPVYLDPPYTSTSLTEKLEEASLVFPQIESCLPRPYWLLATKYAVNYLYQADSNNCYNGRQVSEIKSLDDKVVFNVSKGNSHTIGDNTWGARLLQLLMQHGCYVTVGQARPQCDDHGCGGTCG